MALWPFAGTKEYRSRRRTVYMLILVLLSPVFLGAKSNKWILVGEHDVTFATGLASAEVRFGPRFIDEVIRGKLSPYGCNPKPSRLVGVEAAQLRQINLYSEHHCHPWYEAWADALWPCEGRFAPRWCRSNDEELIASHLKIAPYFESLTTALGAASDPLVRYNLMAVISDRLRDEMLRDYPKGVVDTWVSKAASVFLERAQAEDALTIGWLLYSTPFGVNPLLARAYGSYLAPNATAEQRRLLAEVVRGLEGKIVPSEVCSLLRDRYGHRSPPAPLGPARHRTDPQEIALLVARVENYYRLMRDRQFIESLDLMSIDYREEYTPDEYVRMTETAEEGYEILEWQVLRVQVSGDTAKVFAKARRNERVGIWRREETLDEEATFWVYENHSWYRMTPGPVAWKNYKMVEVLLSDEHRPPASSAR